MPKYELSGLDAAVQGRIVTVALLALGASQPVFGSSLPFVMLAAVVVLLLGLWLRHADAPGRVLQGGRLRQPDHAMLCCDVGRCVEFTVGAQDG